ncbi:MAG: multidrug ABC transporter permease, partial [Candidatus Aenigmatarchaeota archaeon]
LEGVPGWLSALSHLDPLTYGVEGLRWSLLGVSYIPWTISVAVLVGFSVLMIALGSYLFGRTEV